MLGGGQKALAIGKIAHLFGRGPLSDISDLVHLVLGFTNRALFDASVIVSVNAPEV